MAEVDDFLAAVRPTYDKTEIALHDGNPEPRIAMWSGAEPVTLFGAAVTASGRPDVEAVFRWLGERFARCTAYRNEIVAAGACGDLAYTAALEHITASVDGSEPVPYTLRATTVFRREGGVWKVVHRHGDPLQTESAGFVLS